MHSLSTSPQRTLPAGPCLAIILGLLLSGPALAADKAGAVRPFEADGHPGMVTSVTISADGRLALSAGDEYSESQRSGVVWRVWSLATGREIRVLHRDKESSGREPDLLLTPDGRSVLEFGRDAKLQLWDVETGKEVRGFDGPKEGAELAVFSPDGQRLVTGGRDQTLRVWDVETGKEQRSLEGFKGGVNSVQFAAGGKHVLAAGGSGERVARVFDVDTGKVFGQVTTKQNETVHFSVSGDGRLVLSGTADNVVRLWNVETGKEKAKWTVPPLGPLAHLEAVALSPDGKRFLAAGHSGKAPRAFLVVCDAESGKQVASAFSEPAKNGVDPDGNDDGHIRGVESATFSADGSRVFYVGERGYSRGGGDPVGVLDVATGKRLQHFSVVRFDAGPALALAFSPDGKQAVSGHRGILRTWDVSTGRELTHWAEDKQSSDVLGIAYAPDGKSVVSATREGAVRLWSVDASGKTELKRSFAGHKGAVHGVAFCPDGRRILTAGGDGTARLWDVETGKETASLNAHKGAVHAVAVSSDGKRIATGGLDKSVRLWNVESGKEVMLLKGHTLWVASVALSADGKRVLSGSGDGTVRLWDGETGKEVSRSEEHAKAVTSVAFSVDGRCAVSGSEDGTVRCFELDAGKRLEEISERTPIRAIALSPDGSHVLAASGDSTMRLWRLLK